MIVNIGFLGLHLILPDRSPNLSRTKKPGGLRPKPVKSKMKSQKTRMILPWGNPFGKRSEEVFWDCIPAQKCRSQSLDRKFINCICRHQTTFDTTRGTGEMPESGCKSPFRLSASLVEFGEVVEGLFIRLRERGEFELTPRYLEGLAHSISEIVAKHEQMHFAEERPDWLERLRSVSPLQRVAFHASSPTASAATSKPWPN